MSVLFRIFLQTFMVTLSFANLIQNGSAQKLSEDMEKASVSTEFLKSSNAPEGTKVRSFTYNGSGCKLGNLFYGFDEEVRAISYTTPEFITSIGPSKGIQDSRKFCQINLDLIYPERYQYTIRAIETKGSLSLPEGIEARVTGTYYFSGQSEEDTWRDTFNGPKHSEWQLGFALASDHGIWSPCGKEGALNVKIDATLPFSSTENASIFAPFTSFSIKWKSCGEHEEL